MTSFADGFGPSQTAVFAAIEQADIRQLAKALCPGAFQNDFGTNGFACPRCGAWTAEVLSPHRWICNHCHAHSTYVELRRHVSEDVYAALRLAMGST